MSWAKLGGGLSLTVPRRAFTPTTLCIDRGVLSAIKQLIPGETGRQKKDSKGQSKTQVSTSLLDLADLLFNNLHSSGNPLPRPSLWSVCLKSEVKVLTAFNCYWVPLLEQTLIISLTLVSLASSLTSWTPVKLHLPAPNSNKASSLIQHTRQPSSRKVKVVGQLQGVEGLRSS